MARTEHAIRTNDLTRTFGNFTAVDSVSFSVERGSIFGMLGPNGAGKSTTIRMLSGILGSTSGTAEVAGFDINKQPEEIKKRIGYMSQRFSLYNDLTVEENIRFFGGVYGLSDRQIDERTRWAVELADLGGKEHRPTASLAGGYKQRLALGCALLHEPEVIFLDEPTGGVDPLSRRRFWDIIHQLAEGGASIIVSTHYLDEAEYCNSMILMHNGRLIAQGSPGELKHDVLDRQLLEIESSDPAGAMKLLREEPWTHDISIFGTYLHMSVDDPETQEEDIRRILEGRDIDVRRIERIEPSLEDAFIHLIEREQNRKKGGGG